MYSLQIGVGDRNHKHSNIFILSQMRGAEDMPTRNNIGRNTPFGFRMFALTWRVAGRVLTQRPNPLSREERWSKTPLSRSVGRGVGGAGNPT